MSPHAIIVRILIALHATLARWLAEADRPVARKSKCSWFSCDPDGVRAVLPRDPDDEVAERRRRNTFRIGQR